MDREEFMNKKRIQFEEFLEVLETMNFGQGQKYFIDKFYNYFFNTVYDQGAHNATERNLKIMNEMKKELR